MVRGRVAKRRIVKRSLLLLKIAAEIGIKTGTRTATESAAQPKVKALRSSTTIEPSLETSTPINTDNGVLRICAYGAMRQAKGRSKYCEEEGGFHCWLNQVAIQILHGTEQMSAVSSYTIIPSFITQSSDEFVISAFYANEA